MESTKVSKKMLSRLPGYLNHLKALPAESENVSAASIARALGLGEVQVRKDLAKISNSGRRRTGRCREQFIQDIEKNLDFALETGTIIVGTGKLGSALLDYEGFNEAGLKLTARLIAPEVSDGVIAPGYINGNEEDVCAEGIWQNYFTVRPEPLTAEEKRAWLDSRDAVSLGSDAFFPFPDSVKRSFASGVKYIAEPGGSIRDDLVIDECNKKGMAMCFTGMRLFHH